MQRWCLWALPFLFLTPMTGIAQNPGTPPGSGKVLLRQNWQLQSSCKVEAKGEQISQAMFRPQGWHKIQVPSTVVAALVADKTFPDPYFGMNLRQLPGVSYPIGENFSLLEMPKDSPFAVPWWYRTEFTLPAISAKRKVSLHLDGLSFRANVWLNGKQIGKAEDIAGTWRLFEIDATAALHA